MDPARPLPPPGAPSAVAERIMEAVLACADRLGLSVMTVEDVAAAAGVSRATVYRYFPGGRAQLVEDTVRWEVARFFTRLAEALPRTDDLEALLVEGLARAQGDLARHALFQKLLATEPDILLPSLASAEPATLGVVRAFMDGMLEHQRLRPGVDRGEAADYLARMVLSYLGSTGRWGFHDREQVRQLVRAQLLAGVLEPARPPADQPEPAGEG